MAVSRPPRPTPGAITTGRLQNVKIPLRMLLAENKRRSRLKTCGELLEKYFRVNIFGKSALRPMYGNIVSPDLPLTL